MLKELVQDTTLNLLLVGGEAEGARLERLAGPLPSARVQVARQLPLPELAGRLRGCRWRRWGGRLCGPVWRMPGSGWIRWMR